MPKTEQMDNPLDHNPIHLSLEQEGFANNNNNNNKNKNKTKHTHKKKTPQPHSSYCYYQEIFHIHRRSDLGALYSSSVLF